jgi:hypothetical protein
VGNSERIIEKLEPPKRLAKYSAPPTNRKQLANPARDGWRRSRRETRRPWWRGVWQAGEQLGDAYPTRCDGGQQTGRLACLSIEKSSTESAIDGIPHAPPGPGLTHARVKDIIKLFAEEPEKAKAVFEAERSQTERWAEIIEVWPWLAPAIPKEAPLEDFRRLADGLSARLGGHRQAWRVFARMYRLANAERAKALKAYGNAIVSDCAQHIGKKILDHENRHGNITLP